MPGFGKGESGLGAPEVGEREPRLALPRGISGTRNASTSPKANRSDM